MATESYGNVSIKGVDISYCQKGIDYNKLKSEGVKFAIIRAGCAEKEDVLLETHVKGCQAVGIDYGYYWFSYAKDIRSAQREAAACLKAIGRFPAPKYPVFFDGETNSIALSVGKQVMTNIALTFIEEIELGGYPSGLYVNPDWLENKYDKSFIIGEVDIWLAAWTFDLNKKTKYDYGQIMWQWGIEKYGMDVDADLCYIDYPARTAEWYENHKNKLKTVEQIAIEVIGGHWGDSDEREKLLTDAGYDYDAVQAEVSRMLGEEKKASEKSVSELAVEVIRGLWGCGSDRKQRLTAAGYDYEAVQAEVDRMIK